MSKFKDILNKAWDFVAEKAVCLWAKVKELVDASKVGAVIDRFLRANGWAIIMTGLTAFLFTLQREWWGIFVVLFMIVGILKNEVSRHKIAKLEDELANQK